MTHRSLESDASSLFKESVLDDIDYDLASVTPRVPIMTGIAVRQFHGNCLQQVDGTRSSTRFGIPILAKHTSRNRTCR